MTDSVRQILRDNRTQILNALPAALAAFYRHIALHPSVAGIFADPDRMAHASRKQLEHWERLLEATFDEAYLNSVRQIGHVHHAIGLEPTWYIGGYNFLLRSLISIMAIEDISDDIVATRDPLHATPVQQAITSAMMLDMDLSIEVYMRVRLSRAVSRL